MTVLEAIEKARKAQQKYFQTHDVQLELELDHGILSEAEEGETTKETPSQEQGS